MKKTRMISTIVLSLVLIITSVGIVCAQDHYIENKVQRTNDEYAEPEELESDDPHSGWELGDFIISGFTKKRYVNGKWVFLKKIGDKVVLSYKLKQNINKLHDDEEMKILKDKNSTDKAMGVEHVNFDRGALFVRKTNFENKVEEPVKYFDYLYKKAEVDANKTVELCEEGDYEVALDYAIDKYRFLIPNEKLYYRMNFNFSVRNANCMAFLFDLKTGSELINGSHTENGFYIDKANSKYIDVFVKKETLTDNGSRLEESKDIRFDVPAKDGDQYKDEGIYTVTVKNDYTKVNFDKVIYVGDNKAVQTFISKKLAAKEAKESVKQDETINNNSDLKKTNDLKNQKEKKITFIWMISAIAAWCIIILIIIVLIAKRRKRKRVIEDTAFYEDDEETIEFEEEE